MNINEGLELYNEMKNDEDGNFVQLHDKEDSSLGYKEKLYNILNGTIKPINDTYEHIGVNSNDLFELKVRLNYINSRDAIVSQYEKYCNMNLSEEILSVYLDAIRVVSKYRACNHDAYYTPLDCARGVELYLLIVDSKLLWEDFKIGFIDVWNVNMDALIKMAKRFGKYSFRAYKYISEIIENGVFDIEDFEYMNGIHVGELYEEVTQTIPARWVYQGKIKELKKLYAKVSMHDIKKLKKWQKKAVITNAGYELLIREGVITNAEYKNKLDIKDAWKEHFGRTPKNGWVHFLSPELISMLKESNNFKYFMKAVNPIISELSYENNHVVTAIANMAIVFGADIINMVRNKTIEEIHDMGINIKPAIIETKAERVFFNNHKSNINQALMILRNYKKLELSLNQDFETLLKSCGDFNFENVKDVYFAIECAKHTDYQEDFEKWQDKFMKFKTHEALPYVKVVDGDYTFEKLSSTDPVGVFLGEYTDCCQHPGNVGKSCAWHGHTDPNGAFYVIRKKRKIIAQSWSWRNGDVVVFDNVEALSGYHGTTRIVKMYEEASKLMIGKLGIAQVNAGLGYDDMDLDTYFEITNSIQAPNNCYTDASNQVVLASVRR